jgi:hypothetical protein
VNTAFQDLPHKMKATLISFQVFSATLFLALACPAAQLYVSPGGSDANAGTRGRPFATL